MSTAGPSEETGRSHGVSPSESGRAPTEPGFAQKIAERRAEAERLLANGETEAAAAILTRLAKLPQESSRETAAWARRQLQRLRARSAGGDSVRRPPGESGDPSATSRDAADRATNDGDVDGNREGAGTSSPGAPLNRMAAFVVNGPALAVLASLAAFLVGFLGVSAAMRPPVATVRIEVDEAARGQSLGIGLSGKLYEADSLPPALTVPPGRHTVGITQNRVERATLELELENGESRRLRLEWKQGVPELQLPGADGSVLARSIVVRQPEPPPEPIAPKKPTPPVVAPPVAKRPTTPPGGTQVSKPDTGTKPVDAGTPVPARPALTPQEEGALLTKIAQRTPEGLSAQVQVSSGGGVRIVNLDREGRFPPETIVGIHATVSRSGLAADTLRLLSEHPRLMAVTLRGTEWAPHELESLRGHSSLQLFALIPEGTTFSQLAPFPGASTLADIRSLQMISVDCATFSDDDVRTLARLRRLSSLHIAADALTPTGIARLGELPALQFLRLRWMDTEKEGATDDLVRGLDHPTLTYLDIEHGARLSGGAFTGSRMPLLNSLMMRDCPSIDDGALRNITEAWPQLLNLTLNKTFGLPRERMTASAVTDAGLDGLKSMRNLSTLALVSAEGITDAGARKIAECTTLTTLDLSGCSITDDGAAAFASLKLLTLGLGRMRVGDAACSHLARIEGLFSLNLDGTDVTDKGVLQFRSLKKLRQLNVRQTAVTSDAAKALREANPMLNVTFGP